MELIDRQAFLKNKVWNCGGSMYDPYYNGYSDALNRVQEVLEETPTVDAVEVVRCEKCKHYKQYTSYKSDKYCNWGKCLLISMDVDMPTTGFCCFGDRREEHG